MDDTVGSLTQSQKSLVIGSILGDGYLRILPRSKNAILEINHSFKQKNYVDWKYVSLSNICSSPPKVRKSNNKRIAYRFYSKQLPELTKLYKLFYKNGRKIIPENITLNPLILAVWFMDDGSRCRDRDIYLNTQQFRIEDQKRLVKALEKLGLKATINKDKKYYRLRFIKSSIRKLREILEDKVIPSMNYKMSYNPVETIPIASE